MDTFFVLLAFALIGVIMLAVMKQENRVYAICLSIALGAAMLLLAAPQLSSIVRQIKTVADRLDGGTSEWIGLIIKITVAALLGEWGIGVCRDAGENAVSVKLEIAVKALLLVMSLPIVLELLELIFRVLEDIKIA